jgi:hypothetical protein
LRIHGIYQAANETHKKKHMYELKIKCENPFIPQRFEKIINTQRGKFT